jgi:hypothetical protein
VPINAAWHRAHRMPRNPTVEQRLAWHEEHARECSCRPMPDALRKQVEAFRSGKPETGRDGGARR